MLGLLAFAFKLIFSAVLGGIFGYVSRDGDIVDNDTSELINHAMISVLATSLVALTVQFPVEYRGFSIGMAIFTILYIANTTVKSDELSKRLKILFVSIIGIIIGIGYILQACFLCFILFVMLNNSSSLFGNMFSNNKEDNTENS